LFAASFFFFGSQCRLPSSGMFPGCNRRQRLQPFSFFFLPGNFQNMSINYLLLWLPMILIAFANAILRELVFIKHYNESRAHQLSTIVLIILCSVYVWFVFPLLKIQSSKQAFVLGFVWVLLTVAFEFSLGRLTNKSWEFLFQNYNLFAGRIWLLFLICLFILPYFFYVIRNR
jgi:hypothetical protein